MPLRFALVGGPKDYHVWSPEWAEAAVKVGHAFIELEARSRPDAFGFITDVDYLYGTRGPIRSVVRQLTGSWPTTPRGSGSRLAWSKTRPSLRPEQGYWYISKENWRSNLHPPPVVYIYSVERVIQNKFGQACEQLLSAIEIGGYLPPLVITPDGGGARAFANRGFGAERDRIAEFLPQGFDIGPLFHPSSPSLTGVILENGKMIRPKLFLAATRYLQVRHRSRLSVFDVIADTLLSRLALDEHASALPQ